MAQGSELARYSRNLLSMSKVKYGHEEEVIAEKGGNLSRPHVMDFCPTATVNQSLVQVPSFLPLFCFT